MEDRFRALVLKANLPRPMHNATIELDGETFEVDAHWPGHDLVVELDGRRAHGTTAAFEGDRLRHRRLAANGYTVLRITWRHLIDSPHEVIADLSACMRRLSGRPRAVARHA
jgi:very-short-patch-repair endonuclease